MQINIRLNLIWARRMSLYLIFSGKELIETLPKEVNLGMFELYCEDLIQNLYRKTGVLRESILRKMQQDHQVCSIINRYVMYESIKTPDKHFQTNSSELNNHKNRMRTGDCVQSLKKCQVPLYLVLTIQRSL